MVLGMGMGSGGSRGWGMWVEEGEISRRYGEWETNSKRRETKVRMGGRREGRDKGELG